MPLGSRSIRIGGETLEVVRPGDFVGEMGVRRISPVEAAWLLRSIGSTAPMLDNLLRADLSSLVASLGGAIGRGGSRTLSELAAVVADALRSETLVALRTARPTAVERAVPIERLGPQPEVLEDDTPEDIYVIAAAVKLIGDGDVPYVNSRVRILDPDTGEEVVAAQTTDDQGVVRAIVPENKVYRIEIADLDLVYAAPPLPREEPHPHLKVRFVDATGAPVAHRAVVARYLFDEQQSYSHATDEDGRIDAAAAIPGPYELSLDDEVFVVHTLCARDRDDDGAGYELVTTEPADDSPGNPPVGRLERVDHLFAREDLEMDADDAQEVTP